MNLKAFYKFFFQFHRSSDEWDGKVIMKREIVRIWKGYIVMYLKELFWY
jgi:hypothetical protein